jgi:hypothetical protein
MGPGPLLAGRGQPARGPAVLGSDVGGASDVLPFAPEVLRALHAGLRPARAPGGADAQRRAGARPAPVRTADRAPAHRRSGPRPALQRGRCTHQPRSLSPLPAADCVGQRPATPPTLLRPRPHVRGANPAHRRHLPLPAPAPPSHQRPSSRTSTPRGAPTQSSMSWCSTPATCCRACEVIGSCRRARATGGCTAGVGAAQRGRPAAARQTACTLIHAHNRMCPAAAPHAGACSRRAAAPCPFPPCPLGPVLRGNTQTGPTSAARSATRKVRCCAAPTPAPPIPTPHSPPSQLPDGRSGLPLHPIGGGLLQGAAQGPGGGGWARRQLNPSPQS